jgi:hypothetical protein
MHRVVISSGETVTLKQVTVGKQHRFTEGLWWQHVLSRLPFAWCARFKRQTITLHTTNETAIAWLMWTGLPTQVYTFVPNYVVTDERGQSVYLTGVGGVTRLNDNAMVDARPLTVPSAGKMIRLGLYRSDTNDRPLCIAEFKIPKPRRRAAVHSLLPEPLPIRRTEGKTGFALTELLVETDVRTNRGFSAPLMHLSLRVTEDGLATTNWRLRKLHLSDAAGNQGSYQVTSYPNARGEEYWSGGVLLFPDEPAWKLKLEFEPRDSSIRETRRVEMVVKPRIVTEPLDLHR